MVAEQRHLRARRIQMILNPAKRIGEAVMQHHVVLKHARHVKAAIDHCALGELVAHRAAKLSAHDWCKRAAPPAQPAEGAAARSLVESRVVNRLNALPLYAKLGKARGHTLEARRGARHVYDEHRHARGQKLMLNSQRMKYDGRDES